MLVTHRMVQPTPTTSPARDSEAASPPPRLGSPEDPRARHTSLPSIVVRPSTSAASAGSRPVKKRSVAVNSSEDESPDLRKKRIEEWSRETLLRISRSSSDDVKMKEEHRDSNPETKMKLEESKGEDNDQPQDLSVRRRDQECQTESTCDREEATTSKVKRRKRRSTSPIPSFAVKKRPMTSEVKTEENDDDEEEEEAKEDKTPPSNAPLPQTELVLTYLRKLFMRAMCQLLLRPRQANLIGVRRVNFSQAQELLRTLTIATWKKSPPPLVLLLISFLSSFSVAWRDFPLSWRPHQKRVPTSVQRHRQQREQRLQQWYRWIRGRHGQLGGQCQLRSGKHLKPKLQWRNFHLKLLRLIFQDSVSNLRLSDYKLIHI